MRSDFTRKLIAAQLLGAVGLVSACWADPAIKVELNAPPVVVRPAPEPIIVTEPRATTEVIETPAPPPPTEVVYEPYPVEEDGVTVRIDPEDYYYIEGGHTYHHLWNSDRDIVVETAPRDYHVVHHRIDLDVIPEKHFHHGHHHHEVKKEVHREEVREDRHGEHREEHHEYVERH